MEHINKRIKQEIYQDAVNKLTDNALLDVYKRSESVKKNIIELENILDEQKIENIKKQNIINAYLLRLIPAGTKGVVRGNKFNQIVKEVILNISLDNDLFEIEFEKISQDHKTEEKPDWFIQEKSTKKIIIGMNQLDLWSGGAQTNRGSKYLINNIHNTEQSKLLCIICNEIQFKTKNKAYGLFEVGFRDDTLCYLNNVKNIIYSFFNIE